MTFARTFGVTWLLCAACAAAWAGVFGWLADAPDATDTLAWRVLLVVACATVLAVVMPVAALGMALWLQVKQRGGGAFRPWARACSRPTSHPMASG